MIITGQRDWQTATEFLSLSPLVCLVHSETDGLDNLCKPWSESWILMLLHLGRADPGALSESWDSLENNRRTKDKEDCGKQRPEPWTGGGSSTHPPPTKPNHLHSLPFPMKTTNPCQSGAFVPQSRAPQMLSRLWLWTWTTHAPKKSQVLDYNVQIHTGHPGTLTSQ